MGIYKVGIFEKDGVEFGYAVEKDFGELLAEYGVTFGGEMALDNKLDILASDTKIDLPSINSAHQVIYSYSGNGSLIGFSLKLNSEKVFVRLVVDSVEIMDLDCAILKDFDQEKNILGCLISWEKENKIFRFCADKGLSYSSSVSIEARANQNRTDKDMKAYIVEIVKTI